MFVPSILVLWLPLLICLCSRMLACDDRLPIIWKKCRKKTTIWRTLIMLAIHARFWYDEPNSATNAGIQNCRRCRYLYIAVVHTHGYRQWQQRSFHRFIARDYSANSNKSLFSLLLFFLYVLWSATRNADNSVVRAEEWLCFYSLTILGASEKQLDGQMLCVRRKSSLTLHLFG